MTDDRSPAQGEPGPEGPDATAGTGIDTSVPHSARIWNYWLGGKDNYAVDRAAGDQFSAIYPQIVDIARADRAFLGRVIRYLAGEAGMRQLLDVGTGLPTVDNTHQVAQRVAPESRVVYVDNDPLFQHLWVPRTLSQSLTWGVALDDTWPGLVSGCAHASRSGTVSTRVTTIRLFDGDPCIRLARLACPVRPRQGR